MYRRRGVGLQAKRRIGGETKRCRGVKVYRRRGVGLQAKRRIGGETKRCRGVRCRGVEDYRGRGT